MLEVLVHLEVDSIPPPFQLMRIQVPDGLPHSAWPNSARSDLSTETAEWGDSSLARGDTALARVPSAISPDSFNCLINPLHSSARQPVTPRSEEPRAGKAVVRPLRLCLRPYS